MSKVQVWADGFGLWHASVPIVSDANLNPQWRKMEHIAREAIRDALAVRESLSFDRRTIGVKREMITGHGTVKFVETHRR